MRLILCSVVFVPLGSAALAAGSISPTIALPLAAIVGGHDPALPTHDKATLTALLDGKTLDHAKGTKIVVTAPSIVCRKSNVALIERSCELTFGTRKVTITGRAAHELDATLSEAGAQSEGAAGSIFKGESDLRFTVIPSVVLENGGAGAGCTFGSSR